MPVVHPWEVKAHYKGLMTLLENMDPAARQGYLKQLREAVMELSAAKGAGDRIVFGIISAEFEDTVH